jgi:hypothetical protein
MFLRCHLYVGECGELGRHAPPMKVNNKVTNEPEYDMLNILQHHLTPGHMYIASCNEDGTGTAATTSTRGSRGNRDATTPALVAIKDVKSFGCGSYHSMAVVVGDIVYVCGLNNYGQLGLGDEDTAARDYLTEVPQLRGRGVVALKGGVHHSLALTGSGALLSFGRGDSGQLGSSKVSIKSAGDFSGCPVRTF